MCQKRVCRASSPARSGALVMLVVLFDVALLAGGCLPEENLARYSSSWEEQRANGGADASMDAPVNAAGAGSEGADSGAAGTDGTASSSSGAGVGAGDASLPDASSPPGPTDAGSAADLDASGPLADAAP